VSSPVPNPAGLASLAEIARKLVWWQAPEETLRDSVRFAAQVMTLGTWRDVTTVRSEWGEGAFRRTLAEPPPGVFDEPSWIYWHNVFRLTPIPPVPRRSFT
jgi:hypothetical protein